MASRFVIEGTWTGYNDTQRKVAHRTVHSTSRKELRAWVEKSKSITFTDGTKLMLAVRDCKPYERVDIIVSYKQLLEECSYYDVDDVNALQDIIEKKNVIKDMRYEQF